MPKVELSGQQIQDLIFIIDNSTFKGANAEKVIELKRSLQNAETERENERKS